MRGAAARSLTLAAALAAAPASWAAEGTCAADPGGEIACEILVRAGGEGASDLGVYNLGLDLERLPGRADGEFELTLAVDAGECGAPPRRFIEEPVRFPAGEAGKRFNFPLFLHRGGTGKDYCVAVSATGCAEGCASRMRMAAGEAAVMRTLESRPER